MNKTTVITNELNRGTRNYDAKLTESNIGGMKHFNLSIIVKGEEPLFVGFNHFPPKEVCEFIGNHYYDDCKLDK